MPDTNAGPLCFILMPFGQKPDAAGMMIDFDAVYNTLIRPSIRDAGMVAIRADEEQTGGIIHRAMFERLILCEFAIADLTGANANVFYELGVRHAVRPGCTLSIFAEGTRLPFDLNLLRALPYKLSAGGVPDRVEETIQAITGRLRAMRESVRSNPKAAGDSPVFTLVEGMVEQQISGDKTDVFREQVRYSQDFKDRLAIARRQGTEAIRAVERDLGPVDDAESGVVVDLLLSYRAVKAWDDMIRLVGVMAAPLAATVMVREQYALALNRAGLREQAEAVLLKLLDERGPSSETYGILGRVYKDRWSEASADPDRTFEAPGLLEKATDAYLKGFESDWRDTFPGVNAVTMMSLGPAPDPRIGELVSVVSYAVNRRVARGKPEYWDHASLLELAVIVRDKDKAMKHLGSTLAAASETWKPETTARNLGMLREAAERRGEDVGWVRTIEDALLRKANPGSPPR